MDYALEYHHVLGTTDFSELGDLALRRAAKMAEESGARFTALHVLPALAAPSPLLPHYDVRTSRSQLRQAKAEATKAIQRLLTPAQQERASIVVRHGDPAEEILYVDVELDPDLIVLATHGRRGWRKWVMGSVAERVLQLATADVLAIRERDPSAVVEGYDVAEEE